MSETAEKSATAEELIGQIPDLSDEELDALQEAEEQREKPRKGVLDAISKEREQRDDADAEDSDEGAASRYTVEELLHEARLITGYSRHHLAGALHGVTGTLSVEEAKARAEAYASKVVGS